MAKGKTSYKIINPFDQESGFNKMTKEELREYSAHLRKTVNRKLKVLKNEGITYSQAYIGVEMAGHKTKQGDVGFEALPRKATKSELRNQIKKAYKVYTNKTIEPEYAREYHREQLELLGLTEEEFGSEKELKNFFELYTKLKEVRFFDRFVLGSAKDLDLLRKVWKEERKAKGQFTTIAQKSHELVRGMNDREIDMIAGEKIDKKTPMYRLLTIYWSRYSEGFKEID